MFRTSTAALERAFRQAASRGDLAQCEAFVKQGVDIQAAGPDSKKTALHWAAQNNHVAVVRYLIKLCALLKRDINGLTAFELTTTPEIKRVILYAFKYNSPISIKTESDAFAYGYHHDFEAIRRKISRCPSLDTFIQLMAQYKLDANSYLNGVPLLDVVCQVNIANWSIPRRVTIASAGNLADITRKEDVAQFHANMRCYEDVVRYLLKQGANPCAYESDAYEGTALHSLLAHEWTDKARLLISVALAEGVMIDPIVRDVELKTILHMGALLKDAEFLCFCLEQMGTAAIDLQDDNGQTALHHAYLLADECSIDVLLRFGANESIPNNKGLTPRDMLEQPSSEIEAALLRFHIEPRRPSKKNARITVLDECLAQREMLMQKMIGSVPYDVGCMI